MNQSLNSRMLQLADTYKPSSEPASAAVVTEILVRARELQGLDRDDVEALMNISDENQLLSLYQTAEYVKNTIYGKRIVIFAPLYIANYCQNECLYCAFRASNRRLSRVKLNQQEIIKETEYLVKQGHKRILMVAGEKYGKADLDYVIDSIRSIYSVKIGHGEIRRVNVNVAPLDVDGFKRLKAEGIGTYQIFQETYHPETYQHVHPAGKKSDYEWRLTALDRAMQAGIDDLGVGVLFGLFDWRFELLALMEHCQYLEDTFGVGPHTISVPRLEPAEGTNLYKNSDYLVSDEDFKKIITNLIKCGIV